MKKVYHALQLPLFSEVDYDTPVSQIPLSDIFPVSTYSSTTVPTKVCTGCDERKKLDEFHYQEHGKFQRSAKCKECVSKHGVEYRKSRNIPPKTDRKYSIYHGIIVRIGIRFIIYLVSKSCTKCGKDLPVDEFYIRRGWPHAKCKQCQIDESVEWYNEHPEQVKQHLLKRQSDPEYIEYHREKEHTRYNTIPAVRQKASETTKAYRKANPLKKREWGSRRDARKQGTRTGKVSYKAILARDGYWCYICERDIDPTIKTGPAKLAFDHMVPLVPRPREPQGTHTSENIHPSHHICNSRKKNKPFHLLTPFERQGP